MIVYNTCHQLNTQHLKICREWTYLPFHCGRLVALVAAAMATLAISSSSSALLAGNTALSAAADSGWCHGWDSGSAMLWADFSSAKLLSMEQIAFIANTYQIVGGRGIVLFSTCAFKRDRKVLAECTQANPPTANVCVCVLCSVWPACRTRDVDNLVSYGSSCVGVTALPSSYSCHLCIRCPWRSALAPACPGG